MGGAGHLARVRERMAAHGFAALLLTSPADIRWLTGFRTEFWESPTRPWFVVVPESGQPIAVVPSIGEAALRRTGVEAGPLDIRTWVSPHPRDDGVSLLAQALRETAGGGPVALPMQAGTRPGFPLADYLRLSDAFDWHDDKGLVRDLRMVKTRDEIEAIRATCRIAGRAFARLPEIARPGVPLDALFRAFRILLHEEGAERVPYLAGAAGQGGYEDVISPATAAPLATGDVLMLDTGATLDGWFCDFDRNLAIGRPGREVADAHRRLIEAVHAAAEVARPGVVASEVHAAMERVCGPSGGGRLGHGLGLQLTEPPSLAAHDATVLEAGMVLTFEPVVELATRPPDGPRGERGDPRRVLGGPRGMADRSGRTRHRGDRMSAATAHASRWSNERATAHVVVKRREGRPRKETLICGHSSG